MIRAAIRIILAGPHFVCACAIRSDVEMIAMMRCGGRDYRKLFPRRSLLINLESRQNPSLGSQAGR